MQAAFFPADVALDNSKHVYVRDRIGIRAIDLDNGTLSTLVPNITTSGQMLFDGDHTLYFGAPHGVGAITNDEVWSVDLNTGAILVIAGSEKGTGLPSGDGGAATMANLLNVSGLALDGQGHLYVADSGFDDVRQIDLATGIISTIAGSHLDVGYTVGYSGDGGPATAATFDSPTGLAYDGAGHLTIVDSHNNVLRQIDLATNIITTIAGNHTLGFGGDGDSPAAAMLYYPEAAAYGPAGNLVIADQGNDRVRRVVLHPWKMKSALTYAEAFSGGIQWTATYSGLSFGFVPTGTVTLSSGSTSLGSGTLSATTDGSGSYIATITSASMPASNGTVTAQYSGDGNYAAEATSITFLTPSYTIAAKPASLTVAQGASGSVTFTVTPQNGFNQAVSFSCDNTTLPKGVTCSFNPASVTPNGSAAVTTTLTVQTTGASVASLHTREKPFSGWLPRGGAVLALAFIGIPWVGRRAWLGSITLMLVAICLGGGVIGCGGGGSNSSSGGGTQNANATPAGTYSIQVTTSAGTTSAAQPVTVSLTVTQ